MTTSYKRARHGFWQRKDRVRGCRSDCKRARLTERCLSSGVVVEIHETHALKSTGMEVAIRAHWQGHRSLAAMGAPTLGRPDSRSVITHASLAPWGLNAAKSSGVPVSQPRLPTRRRLVGFPAPRAAIWMRSRTWRWRKSEPRQ